MRKSRIPLVFVIEYTLEARMQIVLLSDGPLIKRIKNLIWTIKTELKRRQAFSESQCAPGQWYSSGQEL